MVDFKKLKNRNRADTKKLAEMAEKAGGATFKKDERIWTPKRDQNGNAYCKIRFLDLSPADLEIQEKIAAEEGVDAAMEKVTQWILRYDHSFKGPGGWYIESSRTTLGQDEADPVSDYNQEALGGVSWKDASEDVKKSISPRNRKKRYFSNVYIIDDSNNPENNGKVMLFEYGQKIFDKIKSVLHPQFPGEPEFDPFDFFEGADFTLKVFTEKKGKNEFPNYDKSEFSHQKPFMGGDESKIEEIWKLSYSLQDLISPDKFKSYEDLKKRLDKAMNKSGAASNTVNDDDDDADDTPSTSEKNPSSLPETNLDTADSTDMPSDNGEDDVDSDDMEFFKNL